MLCVCVLQRENSGDGCDLRKGDLFVLRWARERRERKYLFRSECVVKMWAVFCYYL